MAKTDQAFTGMLALFERCARLPESERAPWLDRHVHDEDLRIEIELMLAAEPDRTECFEHEVLEHIELFSVEADPELDLEGRFDGLTDRHDLPFPNGL